jgi:cell division protein ZipA
MSQLRWSLLILGGLFVAALAWWEWRRPRQASGALERTGARDGAAASDGAPRAPREPALNLPEMRAREPLAVRSLPVVEAQPEEPDVPVLSPAADAHEREEPELGDMAGIEVETPSMATGDKAPDELPAWVPPPEDLPELPAAPPPLVEWPPESERRIVSLRLIAPSGERFAGRALRQALAAEGFELGALAIFHKPDEARRAILSAASLTRPGTFDRDTMDSQHYGGLSLFAVLPGPKPAQQAFDDLVYAARNLNERLRGVLQDEQGAPLTPARVQALREELPGGPAA